MKGQSWFSIGSSDVGGAASHFRPQALQKPYRSVRRIRQINGPDKRNTDLLTTSPNDLNLVAAAFAGQNEPEGLRQRQGRSDPQACARFTQVSDHSIQCMGISSVHNPAGIEASLPRP